jgi:hypothetical protein
MQWLYIALVTLTWTNPTKNVDGTTIPLSGGESLVSNLVERGACGTNGTFSGTTLNSWNVAPENTVFVVPIVLGPGCHAFRVSAQNQAGYASDPSQVKQYSAVAAPVPKAPTLSEATLVTP